MLQFRKDWKKEIEREKEQEEEDTPEGPAVEGQEDEEDEEEEQEPKELAYLVKTQGGLAIARTTAFVNPLAILGEGSDEYIDRYLRH